MSYAYEVNDFDEDRWSARPYYFTRYYVDGFRSLHHFTLKLEEGLNVFVGPNGAGKTNFIALLDFLSVFFVRGLSAAILSAGGISRVFSQECLKTRYPRVKISISSLADLSPFVEGGTERTLFRFEYELEIRYSKIQTSVYVASERIKFKSLFWDDLAVNVDNTVGTLGIKRKSALEDADPEIEIGSRLQSRGPKNPLAHRSRFRRLNRHGGESDERVEIVDAGPDQSILGARSSVPAFDAIRDSISRGRSFNLNPLVAREPSDITTPPGISNDGSGLSATLYHLEQARKGKPPARLTTRRFSSTYLDTIVEWTKLVLPDLEDVDTYPDPHTGKYVSSLMVNAGDSNLKIPLQASSDGTLKWFSFVCLIVTGGSARTIEEPENFLHPKMQRMLINLIRENMAGRHPGHFILSTHSESVINQCRPDELILFEFRGGSTVAKRLENPHTVAEQIDKTGFGLGYYYSSNAIS